MACGLPAWAVARSIPHSIKRPLETRVWYRYPGQFGYSTAGTLSQPTEVARLLEGGATQKTVTAYNARGMVTSKTDPLGRQTTYTYAANGLESARESRRACSVT
jgi:YD repeat-containing protein